MSEDKDVFLIGKLKVQKCQNVVNGNRCLSIIHFNKHLYPICPSCLKLLKKSVHSRHITYPEVKIAP